MEETRLLAVEVDAVTADPAYDTRAFYGAAGARGARVVVPPTGIDTIFGVAPP